MPISSELVNCVIIILQNTMEVVFFFFNYLFSIDME